MSWQVTTAFVKQFSDTVSILTQQQTSRLEPYVRVETIRGSEAYFDQISATAASKVTSRHADTVYTSTPHARRRVTPVKYVWADLIDDFDKVRMLIDPTNSYTQNAIMALQRAKDSEIISALGGTAYTGADGTTSVPFPSGQVVATSVGGSNTNLNLEKLAAAASLLGAAEAEEERYLVVTQSQLDALLTLEKVTSSLYNQIQPLVSGTIDTFFGFKFIRTQLLSKSGNTRYCYAFTREGILLAMGKDVTASIDRLPQKNNSTQVMVEGVFGATRMDENRVVQIQCYEA